MSRNLTDEMIDLGLIDAPANHGTAQAPQIRPPAPTSAAFVPPQWYPLLSYAMTDKRGITKGSTLFGPRGCGKSTAIRELANSLGATTVTMQCAANMQICDLLGTWTGENGTLRFIDGPLAIAVRLGAWLLAEEANVIHPGVWSAANTLADQTKEGLRLPTGEVIQPTDSFRLSLIYNPGYEGTREVNPALKSRLMPVYCTYLEPDQESDLLVNMTGASLEDCRRVVQVGAMIRAANLRFDVCPRSLSRWIGLVVDAGFSWSDGYKYAIVDLVGSPDTSAPQRACLEEIARNTCDQW